MSDIEVARAMRVLITHDFKGIPSELLSSFIKKAAESNTVVELIVANADAMIDTINAHDKEYDHYSDLNALDADMADDLNMIKDCALSDARAIKKFFAD